MGLKYIWDTGIYFLQQQFRPGAEKYIDDLVKEDRPCVSSITEIEFEIELLCWKTATEKDMDVCTVSSMTHLSLNSRTPSNPKRPTSEISIKLAGGSDHCRDSFGVWPNLDHPQYQKL
jgi:hypothetical protein